MKGFLEQFFPETIGKEATSSGDLYCTYNNQKIQWFTSSLFLAGAATEISGTTGGLFSWTCQSHLMNFKGLQTLVNVLHGRPEQCTEESCERGSLRIGAAQSCCLPTVRTSICRAIALA